MENYEKKREAIISDLKKKLKVIFDLIKTKVVGYGTLRQVHADEIKRNK